jgi:hypothetical protein
MLFKVEGSDRLPHHYRVGDCLHAQCIAVSGILLAIEQFFFPQEFTASCLNFTTSAHGVQGQ